MQFQKACTLASIGNPGRNARGFGLQPLGAAGSAFSRRPSGNLSGRDVFGHHTCPALQRKDGDCPSSYSSRKATVVATRPPGEEKIFFKNREEVKGDKMRFRSRARTVRGAGQSPGEEERRSLGKTWRGRPRGKQEPMGVKDPPGTPRETMAEAGTKRAVVLQETREGERGGRCARGRRRRGAWAAAGRGPEP